MRRFYYDLHIHSCLSPCADDDNTPYNLVGMANLLELDIIALTDHNSVKNCPAFFSAAREYGLVPIAGMELTTSEDIHIICLFPTLSSAMDFGEEIENRRVKIKNRADIFGEQLIYGKDDEIVGKEDFLLSNATTLSLEDVPALAERFGGVCYPAHIDRDANGIISTLGDFPKTPHFTAYELRDRSNKALYEEKYGLKDKYALINSDSHALGTLSSRENYIELDTDGTEEDIRARLIKMLRQI